MAVSIVSSQTISGDTFYRNKPFDISFSYTSTIAIDASLYFGNSTFGVLPYIDTSAYRFSSASGISTIGPLGTVSVDAVMANPAVVTTVTPKDYFGLSGVALDPAGLLYLADTNRNQIVQFDMSTNTGTVWAGTGVAGDANGPRLTAQFRSPLSVSRDASGNFYVTDLYRVRKIDTSGIVSLLAGGTTQAYTDSVVGSNARFVFPNFTLPQPNGDLLVTDSDAHAIRNVTPTGIVTTYVGGIGPGFADGSLNTVTFTRTQFLRGAGASTTLYDTSDLTMAWRTDASMGLTTVYAVASDTRNIESNRILYGGTYSSTYLSPLIYQSFDGSFQASTGFDTSLDSVRAIAFDPSGIAVAGGIKAGSNRAPYVSTNGGETWTTFPNGSNVLQECYTVAYGNGKWLAAGYGRKLPLTLIDSSANLLVSTDGSTWTATEALHPIPVVYQIAYGNGAWVAVGLRGSGSNLAVSTDNGVTWTKSVGISSITGVLTSVAYGAGVWVIGADETTVGNPALAYSTDLSTWSLPTCNFFTDIKGIRNIHYSTTQRQFIASGKNVGGSFSNVFTSPDGLTWSLASNTSTDILTMTDISQVRFSTTYGTGKLHFPCQLTYDSGRNLYVADAYNNRIRRILNGGTTIGTYAGTGTGVLTEGGPRLTSGIALPVGLGFTADGSLFITSFERRIVQKIAGDRTFLAAGRDGIPGSTDGTPSNALFNGPGAIATQGLNVYLSEVFNGNVRRITTFPEVRPGVDRVPTTGTIVATSNYPITINSRIDVCWTSVGGQLPLFKFEPFCNSFVVKTSVSGDRLTYATSSTELLGYLSGTGTRQALFRGPNGASTAYTYPLSLTVRASSNGVVVDDVSTTVTISPARLVYSPCNAALVFYRNEPSPAPVFSIVASNASLIYAATTLPTGLAFTRTDAKSFALTGTPTVQTITSNYTILGTDTSGRTYSTQVSMVVNPERLVVDVSGDLTLSNVGTGGPIAPITFTSRFPPYGSYRAMRYTWSPPPPAGIQFRDVCGTALSGSNYFVDTTYDASFTLTLSGTITEAQLRAFAEANVPTYTMTLTGTRTSPLPSLSPSLPKTITFKFGEFVDMSSNVPSRGLYVGLPVSDYWYSATTYFPQTLDTSIASIEVTDGFLPDGLDASFTRLTQRFTFAGTPTTATTYRFTLTASNDAGVSTSLPVTAVVSTDSVTITGYSDTCFNFIQTRSLSNAKPGFYPYPISYSVASASGCNAVLSGANLPAGVSLVSNGTRYDLSGRPTTATALTTATLTGLVPATGVTATKTFDYSVSAETFFFSRDPEDISFNFIQNVPITPVQIDVSTLSENSVIRFSAPSIPSALQVTNTGLVRGTPLGSTPGVFGVTAFTAYASGSKTYSYAVTPDQVLLQPTVYTTTTTPGGSVSIPILGYSLSAVTVSNYRFESAFPYGLSVNPTTGLLSGTLASSLPSSVPFTILGSAGTVDGSLGGTMTTDNLTTSRAQVLEIQSQSNLRVYYSDDRGSNWGLAVSSNGLVAGRVGVNGVDTYLIPTSSDLVLRSTTGSNYTTSALGQSALAPLMTGVTYNPASSTWWIGGTLSNGTRSVYVFKTLNDGLTWDAGTLVAGVQDRSSNATPGAGVYDAYLYGGVDIAYKDGVLLLGGTGIARSVTDGATWSAISSPLIEVARFSLDQETVWLAVGSSLYSSRTENAFSYTGPAVTIVYSLDQGLTWTPAASAFTMNAYEVLYANGVWLASGLDRVGPDCVARIRYSFDGVNWPVLTALPSLAYVLTLDIRPPGPLGTIGYDQGEWKIIWTPDDGTATLYSHPGDGPIDSGWTSTVITSEFPGIGIPSRFSSYVVQTIDPGADVTTITFPLPNTGPTFVSPAQSTYVVWQYMPLPPIVFSAPGATAYFITSLPVGLTWTSTTRTITGACMRLGTQTFTVYARDGTGGVSTFTVTLIVNVPRIIKQQGGAGAYTALVRDYTEVAAAINARDTRVNPVEESALGSFASPYAPDVVTPSNCPC